MNIQEVTKVLSEQLESVRGDDSAVIQTLRMSLVMLKFNISNSDNKKYIG